MPGKNRPIAAAAQGDLDLTFDQLAAFLGTRERADAACPACGPSRRHAVNRRRRVLRIWRHDPEFITYCCARCGARGWAKSGEWKSKAKSSPLIREPAPVDMLATAERIWCAAVPIIGTQGAAYLASRGIDLDTVGCVGLRFHPRCPWGTGTAACIIARFTHAVTGVPLGIRRRRIDTSDTPRSLGATAGGVIRLSPDEDAATGLVIGEGVETCLAAMTRIEHRGTLLRPAWACGSAGAMADFPVLSGIEALTILVDNDHTQTGQTAAQQCAERWAEAQREVTLLTPRDLGVDFNDLIRETPS